MKKFNKICLALVWTLVLCVMSMMSSCEAHFSEMSELQGNFLPDTVTNTVYDTLIVEKVIIEHDSVLVYIHDTIYVTDTIHNNNTDTVYVTHTVIDTVVINNTDTVYKEIIVTDTVVITKELYFDCYDFDGDGRLVVTSSEGKKYLISYNLQMETSGDVYFKQETKDAFVLEDSRAYFEGNTAYFNVSKGTEKITLGVNVKGASYVIVNNQDVTPCYNFYVEAELTNLSDREINGVMYEVAVVNYYFYNAEGNVVEIANQLLFAPKYEEEPVNEREVTIEYTIEPTQSYVGYTLVINGKIDNSIWSDTLNQVRIPLFLDIKTEAKKTVIGDNFDFSYVGGIVDVTTSVTKSGLSNQDGDLKVTYNEYEKVTNHLVSASGNQITNQQIVTYLNNFTVEFGGQTENINLDLNVVAIDATKASVTVESGMPTQKITIPYQATLDKLSASANQEIEVSIKAVYFDGEEITFANKSVAFKDVLGQALRFTCVLSKTSDGNYYYRYRQDGVAVWTTIQLEEAEYNWLLSNAKRSPSSAYGLANRNANGTWDAGFIECTDFKDQAWIFSYNEEAGDRKSVV